VDRLFLMGFTRQFNGNAGIQLIHMRTEPKYGRKISVTNCILYWRDEAY